MKNTVKIFIASVSAAVMLCGCAAAGKSSSSTSGNPAAQTAPNFQQDFNNSSRFIDESDVTSAGTSVRGVAEDYTFPEGGSGPELEVEVRTSPDGELFLYDSQNRLCYYRNTDEIYGKADATGEPSQTLGWYARDVVGSYIDTYTSGMTFDSCGNNTFVVRKTGTDVSAAVQLTQDGDIRWMSISYDTLPSSVDESQFADRLNAYIESVKSESEVAEYSTSVRFMALDSTVYALYTVSFTAPDGTVWAEDVGFAQEQS